MANNGGLYLDKTAMTAWRVLVDPKGKNYSAQKVDKMINYYEAMNKYIIYNNAFEISYDYYIYYNYRMCIKKIKSELINGIGHFGIIKANLYKIKARLYKLFHRF